MLKLYREAVDSSLFFGEYLARENRASSLQPLKQFDQVRY